MSFTPKKKTLDVETFRVTSLFTGNKFDYFTKSGNSPPLVTSRSVCALHECFKGNCKKTTTCMSIVLAVTSKHILWSITVVEI